MIGRTLAILLGAWLALFGPARASDPQVRALGQTFVAQLPAGWNHQLGSWNYFSVADCIAQHTSCLGNNPSTPYGYPGFGGPGQLSPFHFGPSEAVVIFMRTPPSMRYFSLTPYLVTRGAPPAEVFGSLGDALNLMKFATLAEAQPAQHVFDQYAVLVWTADLNTLASVQAVLAQQGIAAAHVNFMALPVQLPLVLGDGQAADTFAMVMRTALPEAQADLDAYMAQSPFFVVKVGPVSPPPPVPAPTLGYASEISGVREDTQDKAALDQLVADIQAHLATQFSFKTQRIKYSKVLGLNCVQAEVTCNCDSHDDLLAMDSTRALKVKSLKDVLIVAGVNHHATGKALYISHSVTDPVQALGVAAVDDTQLDEGGALYFAGVVSPNDPRVATYRHLYAHAIAYDCGGLQHCLTIPAPTPDNPVGLKPGTPFTVVARNYVDPHTGVRPSTQEVVPHQVLFGSHR